MGEIGGELIEKVKSKRSELFPSKTVNESVGARVKVRIFTSMAAKGRLFVVMEMSQVVKGVKFVHKKSPLFCSITIGQHCTVHTRATATRERARAKSGDEEELRICAAKQVSLQEKRKKKQERGQTNLLFSLLPFNLVTPLVDLIANT